MIFLRRIAVRFLIALSAGCFAAVPFPSRAADSGRDGFKLVSPNFELYGNGQPSEASRLLHELETFRHVVSRFLGLTNVQRRPALVYLFRDDASFRPFKPRYNDQPSIVNGFHVEDPMDHVLALSRQSKDASTMQVLFHEYTHLLTARPFRDAPIWLHEGVAEVFSTFEGSEDRFDIGVAMTNHAHFLQRQLPMPVLQLLSVTRDSPDYNERSRAGSFYASSWLLAHHLLFARRGFESNSAARYAVACSGTTNAVEAFQSAFGLSPAALDSTLRDYVRGGSYTIVRQTYPELETGRSRSVPLAPGEWDYAMGRLLQMTRQDEPALKRLRRAAELAPRDPRAYEALALLAWRTGQRTNLTSWIQLALRAGSKDAFLHFLSAETYYQDLTANRTAASGPIPLEALEEGRKRCLRALELDPLLAPAHHLLGVYVLAENPKAPALAAVHVLRAVRADPTFKPALLTYASLLAAQGQITQARQILAGVLAGPLPDELRKAARHIAEEIDRRVPPKGPPPR